MCPRAVPDADIVEHTIGRRPLVKKRTQTTAGNADEATHARPPDT